MESDPYADDPAFQIVSPMHQRVDEAGLSIPAGALLEARRANPAQHERAAAHRPHEPQDLQGLLRVAAPNLGSREKFENLGVIVGPHPIIPADEMLGLGNREVLLFAR